MISEKLVTELMVAFGSIISFLLGAILWVLRRFVDGYDKFKGTTNDTLSNHETRITVLEIKK